MSTTAGSRALNESKPLQDSEVTKHLREAGAVILGKVNSMNGPIGESSSSGWSGLNETKNLISFQSLWFQLRFRSGCLG